MKASLLAVSVFLVFCSCTRQTEELQTGKASDYMPLKAGKYIIYRTDSTVFTNFGRNIETHSYQEKHLVEAAITDASGQPAFRIQKFIRALNATTEPWKASGSYMITTSANAELTENNLRYIKLAAPVRTDFQWKGNSYLPRNPYAGLYNGPLYDFGRDDDMEDWLYTYTSTGETITINGKVFNDVITVDVVDESINVPVTAPANAGYKELLREKYAKGVGMIYQEFVLIDYQNGSGGFYVGFGVKRSIIDYN
jgi:hypothetical protein